MATCNQSLGQLSSQGKTSPAQGPACLQQQLCLHNPARSQNHRIVAVGRDLCGSPSPTPCRSRVTHSRLHRTSSRRVWNISREGDSTTSLGSLFRPPSPSEGRSSSSCSAGASSASVCSHCPLSCHWAPLKESGPILLTPTLKKFVGIYKMLRQSSKRPRAHGRPTQAALQNTAGSSTS